MRWEFKIVSGEAIDSEAELNALGAEGWELVNAALESRPAVVGFAIPASGGRNTPIYEGSRTVMTAILKRPLT